MAQARLRPLSGVPLPSCFVKETVGLRLPDSHRQICGPCLLTLTAGRVSKGKTGRFGAQVVVAVADSVNVTESASQRGTQRTASVRTRKSPAGEATREDLDDGVFDRAVLALTDSSKASTPKGRRPGSKERDLVSALANLTTRNNASNGKGELQPNAGDPRGKRQVGKNVVAWLSRGMSQMAADLLDKSSSLQARVREPNFSLVLAAQPYLWKNSQPMGDEAKCQVAAVHLPTLWDHLQREVRNILSKEGSPEKNEAWRKVKSLAYRRKSLELTACTLSRTTLLSAPAL